MAVHAIGASYGAQVPIHLSLDTGMSRGGLSVDQFSAILRRLPRLRHVRLAGIWTHFAAAEADPGFTREQFTRFADAIEQNRQRIPRGVLLHAAATHAALAHNDYHLDMTRIGLGLFGYAPGLDPAACGFDQPLEPIIRWRSRLIHVRKYSAGATVGYNCTTRLARDSFLGLVPVGYADGIPLSASGRGFVQVAPRGSASRPGAQPITAPILGRVNMDQVIVDLTPGAIAGERPMGRDSAADAPSAPLAQVGDLVDIISPDPSSPCSLPNLARAAGTSCYELLCRISPRVPRLYRNAAPSAAVVASERLKVTVA
jgi:alanine racemase